MNGKSKCCNAPTVKDATGDIICKSCGTIQNNNPKKEGVQK